MDSSDESLLSDGEAAVASGRKSLLKRGSDRSNGGHDGRKGKDKSLKVKGAAVIRNKQKVLVLSSRGIVQRYRHLMKDLVALLPHSKKDSKLDTKSKLQVLNELAEDNQCNNVIFFEVRKHKDLYLWLAKTPSGPCIKFHVQNVHTMDELKLAGNCLKGSRPILSFDEKFDREPHYKLVREMFSQMFAAPQGARKIKPFIDRVMSFSICNDVIFCRNYQVVKKDEDGSTSLVEIGPRFSLTIMRVFNGSFTGATLFENPEFVNPNVVRRQQRLAEQLKSVKRTISKSAKEKSIKRAEHDPLEEVFR